MKEAIKVWWRQLLIKLSLRRATLGDALDRIFQHRGLK